MSTITLFVQEAIWILMDPGLFRHEGRNGKEYGIQRCLEGRQIVMLVLHPGHYLSPLFIIIMASLERNTGVPHAEMI